MFINYYANLFADTSDVQEVNVTPIEGANAYIILCQFLRGSNALGCMVVLTGFMPYHVNLSRNASTNSATTTVTLEHPPSCYTGVEAFDIESDGSVGSLAVKGQLQGGRLGTPCSPGKINVFISNRNNIINLWYFIVKPNTTEPLLTLIVVIVVITVVMVVVAVIIILIAIIIILVCKRKR